MASVNAEQPLQPSDGDDDNLYDSDSSNGDGGGRKFKPAGDTIILEGRDLPSVAKYLKSETCKNVFLMVGAGKLFNIEVHSKQYRNSRVFFQASAPQPEYPTLGLPIR
ncbi:hypothetical protein FRB90_004378, partial [Tulasnella sp. 427]